MSMKSVLAAIEENRQLIDAQVANFQQQQSRAVLEDVGNTDDGLLDRVMLADLGRMRDDLKALEQVAVNFRATPTTDMEAGTAQADPPDKA